MPILRLDEIGLGDRAAVGGKAFVLARLKAHGLPVPDGFVLRSGARWDEATRERLREAYRSFGGAVAVRSSSTAEDLEDASFAGQYATFLDVAGQDAVVAAVGACLDSVGQGAAYAALVASESPGAMAVLVQRFVEPRAAGVAFTQHPTDASASLVESHAGRGEALVSGRVTPARHVVDRATGAVRERSGPPGLADHDLQSVWRLAREAEVRLGAPQDVEWAIGGDGVVLLQSRPITVVAEARDPRARRLTRANVGEVLPDPVTPLTWSGVCTLLEGGFQSVAREAGLLPPDLAGSSFLVLHRRRVYLNLSLCFEVGQRLPGISAADAETLVFGAGSARGGAAPPLHLAAVPWLFGVALRLVDLQRRLPGDIRAAQAIVASLPSAESVAAASALELQGLVGRFVATGASVARAHIATSGASAFRLALLSRVVAWLPGDPADLVNRLVAGLPDIESAAPTLALEALAEQARARPDWRAWLAQGPNAAARAFAAGQVPASLHTALRAFFERYGHRAVSEGELAAPSWRDDPTPVFAALETLVAAGRSAGLGHRARATDRRADEAAARHRLGALRGGLFAWALRAAQDWVREREKTKSLAIALVAHGRRLARASARALVGEGRLASEADVFWLSLGELEAALGGQRLTSGVELARRRRRQQRESALPAPREVDLDAPLPEGVVSDSWTGLGASPGIGVGRARVLGDGAETRLEPGEILVAPVLDAGLGPLLASCAGAVAEIGGMLSHGSVVARELGVPCVVDLRDATRRIRTGDRLRVDGGTGRVEILVEEGTPAEAAIALAAVPIADPADERLHAFVADPRARESVYFNAYDPEAGVGVIASMGVRPGDRGEAVLALSLPDGRTLFGLWLERPRCGPLGFDVGGLGTAWSPTTLCFRGRLAAWDGQAFPPGPLPLLIAPRTVEVELQLTLRPASPAIDLVAGLSDEDRRIVEPLGAHHVEQSCAFRGHVTIAGRRSGLEASGSRDHSWGLRDWSAADHWKLFTVRFGDDMALHALSTCVNGHRVAGGFLWRDGRLVSLSRVECAHEAGSSVFELDVQTRTGERLPLRGRIERTLRVPVAPERRPLRHLAGQPWALVLRENFSRYEFAGRVGHGVAEFTERSGPV